MMSRSNGKCRRRAGFTLVELAITVLINWQGERSMNMTRNNSRFPARSRAGYTFIELIVSLASASIIVGGLSSSLYIAGRALDQDGTAKRADADQVLDKFVADVEHAYAFSERTATP